MSRAEVRATISGVGDFKLFKTLIVIAALAGAAWGAINWLQDNPNQPGIQQITPPAVNPPIAESDPFGGR